MHNIQSGSALRSTLITVAVIVVLLAFAAMQLPQGFSDDLSRIGQGRSVVVLTHNKEAVQSANLMDLMNDIRGDYEDRVEFLAVDIGTREGEAFLRRQQVGASVLVLFGPGGERRGVLADIRNEQDLRRALDKAFGIGARQS